MDCHENVLIEQEKTKTKKDTEKLKKNYQIQKKIK